MRIWTQTFSSKVPDPRPAKPERVDPNESTAQALRPEIRFAVRK
jgi:hypothetical protein